MAVELNAESAAALLPERPEAGHKGTFGHLFVIAGSRGFTGAMRLSCEAASRSGVGLVTAGVPYPLGDVAASMLVEAMSLRLPATEAESISQDAFEAAVRFAAGTQAVLLGPGLSRHPETVGFVHDFAAHCPVPLVVDADGLNALSESPAILHEMQSPCVLTPHPGEMARLLSTSTAEVQQDRSGAATAFAREYGCVVVLKGHGTIVAAPDGKTAQNTTGNEGLGSGGTGDVLAGLLGGLAAQGMGLFDAACLAVYVHGLAGDLAAREYTARAMIARDLIAMLPAAWKTLDA